MTILLLVYNDDLSIVVELDTLQDRGWDASKSFRILLSHLLRNVALSSRGTYVWQAATIYCRKG